MGQASRFLRRTQGGYAHWCPACDEMHAFAVNEPFRNGSRWTFGGDVDRPSFSPSMNISWGREADPAYAGNGGSGRCHYFLRLGREFGTPGLEPERPYLQFLSDCTHALKGQAVPLPELPPHVRD